MRCDHYGVVKKCTQSDINFVQGYAVDNGKTGRSEELSWSESEVWRPFCVGIPMQQRTVRNASRLIRESSHRIGDRHRQSTMRGNHYLAHGYATTTLKVVNPF